MSIEMTETQGSELAGFAAFDLIEPVQQAIESAGYQQPSPIQMEAIPHILAGTDVIGQAETGSGKTAAFALPLLSRIDLSVQAPQVLVLTPTRELALQVAESFRQYSKDMQDLRVTAIYGGAGYEPQLRDLDHGMHVVVGTPGRVMDHMRRGALDLQQLRTMVLDEADQMLQMGFIEDVEWILTQGPQERQVVLFSATMPPAIRKIAEQHLRDPEHITIKGAAATAKSIRQRACAASPREKIDVLSRLLDAEPVDGMLVFVKTRSMTNQVAEELAERGYAVAALSGEMAQSKRERTVDQFKSGRINILVATDVAARGLDVDRVSHVVNYDFPHNTEAYVHRIGRTGRAGRAGDAIIFVGRHDQHRLRDLERGTRQRIEWMEKPSLAVIEQLRRDRLRKRIEQVLVESTTESLVPWIETLQTELQATPAQIAAALAQMALGDTSHQRQRATHRPSSPYAEARSREREDRSDRPRRHAREERNSESRSFERRPQQDRRNQATSSYSDRSERFERQPDERRSGSRPERALGDNARTPRSEYVSDSRGTRTPRGERPARARSGRDNMTRYRLEVGKHHGIRPSNIVGALANEGQIDTQQIGAIEIHDFHTTVDLGVFLTSAMLDSIQRIRVAGKPMQISLYDGRGESSARPRTAGGPARARSFSPGRTTDGGDRDARETSRPGHAAGKPKFGKSKFAKSGPGGGKFKSGKSSTGKTSARKPVAGKPSAASVQDKFRANLRKKLRRKAEQS